MEEILKRIETALNTILANQESQVPSIEDLKKVGAKFSSSTLSQLRILHATLGKLIGGDATDDNIDTAKGMDEKEFANVFNNAFSKAIKQEDKKEITPGIEDVIKNVVMDVMKTLKEDK